jgi:hypothetical protein
MNSVGVSPELVIHSQKLRRLPAERTQALGLSIVLLATTVLLYLPVIHHPFANIDDNGYVYENQHVRAGLTWPTIKWALTTFDDNNWHPLTWLSHALDCQMFGINPAGHHVMNAVWHSINVVILFWVLLLATGYVGRSFMVAALFALHPINVESVAWMAERKTLLSTLFFLLALGAYRWYARRPGVLRYAVVACLFILGLMAKPQIIMLPFVFLLWDYWPLGRMFASRATLPNPDKAADPIPPGSLFWLIKEKIPLLVICVASALVTMKAQRVGRPQHWPFSIWIRAGNSIVAYVRYLGKAIWPSHLAIMYLHPGNSLRLWQVAAAALILLAITALVIVGHRHRYLPVGWFWFLGTMIPTIGLVQVGRQALADRYAYQSFLGLFILVCWALADWSQHAHLPKALLPTVSITALLVLTAITHRQIDYWSDNLTLWSHTAQATGNNWMAESMMGGLLFNQGHHDEAMVHYRAVAALNPDDAGSNLAIALDDQQHGNFEDAIRQYQKALPELDDPIEQAKAYQNMAVVYQDMAVAYHDASYTDKAVEYLKKAAKLRKQH